MIAVLRTLLVPLACALALAARPAGELERYAGVYELAPGAFATVLVDGTELRLTLPGGEAHRLREGAPATFVDGAGGLQVEFTGSDETPESLVLGDGRRAARLGGLEDRPRDILRAAVDGFAIGLEEPEAQRLYARARFLADAVPDARIEALMICVQVCEISGSGMEEEWLACARELVANPALAPNLLGRFSFLAARLQPAAASILEEVTGSIADRGGEGNDDAGLLFATRLARLDLALARQRSGTALSADERAAALRQTELLETEHADRRHAFGTPIPQYVERARYELEHLGPGRPAPEIEGEDLEGAPMTLSSHRGKVVMLVFWASWCPPCVKSLPHENALLAELEGRPFALVGVNADADRDKARAFAADRGVVFRSFWNGPDAAQGPIATAWNVNSWPTVYLIDAQGRIRHVFLTGTSGPTRRALEALLAEAESR